MTVEVLLAAVLAATFVAMTALFHRPVESPTRLALKGRKIRWDRPDNISIGEW